MKKLNFFKAKNTENTLILNELNESSKEIRDILKGNLTPKLMAEGILSYHEKDIATTLEILTSDEIKKLFRILPSSDIANILEYADEKAKYFSLLPEKRQPDVISHMEATESSEMFEDMSNDEISSVLCMVEPTVNRDISLIRSFDEDEIGSIMSTDYIAINENSSVKSAMNTLVSLAADNNNISTLYLVDNNNKFLGAIDLKDLIIARESTPISAITTYSYPYLYTKSNISDSISYISEYAESSIPVLDEDNTLIGVVMAEDFMEIIDSYMGDNYAKLGGLTSEEDLQEPIKTSIKKRMPWLCILLFMGLFVSAAVGMFESTVARLPIIMCFQSLILDMAGNVGTQSLAVAIRVLSDTNNGKKQRSRLVLKEMRIGILNGMILGIISFVVIGIYLLITKNPPLLAFSVSSCLCVAMILAMAVSSLFGTLIPIFFKRIGVDPAVASGPLITTVNDLVAVITYYGLAFIILINIMHLA